jgi:DNA-binding NarL/FixJ family response regulator
MTRVYIVDDSRLIRERLKEMLVDIAELSIIGESADPAEALVRIRESRPDAVILDIRLPGISGIELLKRIKWEQPGIQVIMLTNYPHPKYRDQSLAAGADYFFQKATEFDKIPDVLKNLPVVGEC